MIQDNSKRIGNHPLTHTLSSGATFMSSLVYSLKAYKKKGRLIKGKTQYLYMKHITSPKVFKMLYKSKVNNLINNL